MSPYGTQWKRMRNICMIKLLNPKSVESFRFIREEEVTKFIRGIVSCSGCKEPLNLSRQIMELQNCIVSRASFGKRISEKDVENNYFVTLLKQLLQLITAYQVYEIFPILKFLHSWTGLEAASDNIHHPIDKIFENILVELKAKRESAPCELGEESLADMLLGLQECEDLQFPVKRDAIKAVILDMFIAGIENPAIVIEWAMVELIRNPKAMQTAQAEVCQAIKKKRTIEETDDQDLKYLKSVIKETLRLHPPLPLIIRETREQCEIQGYEIPCNTKIIVNAWAIGRDAKHWIDPNCFQPERFIDSTITFRNSNYRYIPFGAGRRVCPGVSFGMASVELPLANLLYHFDWKLPNGVNPEQLDMSEMYLVTAKKKRDLLVHPISGIH